ncbi:MAG: ATP synthase F1 subunit delta [Deltaproteobacteria bacterium]|nr:ATP synthase F1 subunit delta [Deltaproteobacteria bacterium]
MIKKSAARAYARAIIKSSSSEEELRSFRDQLVSVLNTISSSLELGEVLSKPVLAIDKRKSILENVLKKLGCHRVVSNLVMVMFSNYRLHYLKSVVEIIDEEIDKKEGVLRGEFISAYPIDASLISKAEKELSDIIGKKVILNSVIRKEIIGGAIVKIGSLELDGSVLRRINSLENITIV